MADRVLNPRKNADDAYAVFMAMPYDEFRACLFSLLRGGCLEPQEQIGFERALAERKHPDQETNDHG